MPVTFIISWLHCGSKDRSASNAYIQYLVFMVPCFSSKKNMPSHLEVNFCCRCVFILNDALYFYVCLLIPRAYKFIFKNVFKSIYF